MTTIRDIFAGAGLIPTGCVRWGTAVPIRTPGVYAIATTDSLDDPSAIAACPIDLSAVRTLMERRPEIAVDRTAATEQDLSARLSSMWMPSECVVYIGLAGSSLRDRLDDYYTTALGARRPHAGGWPLKLLSILEHLWVHYAACDDPDRSEIEMVGTFVRGLPNGVAASSCDPQTAVPYANLMFPRGRKKRHGISGAKEAKISRRGAARPSQQHASTIWPRFRPGEAQLATRRITASDIAGGRVRIPRETKSIFPRERQHIRLEFRGETLMCRWDPRTGPDRERSGVLSISKVILQRLVRPDEELSVTVVDASFRLI